ncbi:MAG: ABC transporter substrate-binding protein [Dehalococcoidales bacterium]
MKRLLTVLGTALVASALMLSGCSSGPEELKGPIVVGSKIDTEGSLLAQMIILMLRDAGFEVVDKSEFGASSIVQVALQSGELDLYPEYTGNGAWLFGESDSPVWKDAEQGYERVKQLDAEANDIVWLRPAPANNTWAIAVRRDLATEHNLTSLADLADLVNSQPTVVKLIGSEEFISSEAALPAFQEAYGFTIAGDQLVSVSGGNTTLTEKAAGEGTDGVNAAMAYGTDGTIAAFDLVVLSDPLNVQMVYEPAPRVRGEIMDQYPEIAGILDPVFESLTLELLQELNGRIAVDGENAADVAGDYLTSNGFLE